MALTQEQQRTLVWDERVQGFTTFQMYVPDSGISLNNRHFTFHQGGIWEHNIPNMPRNFFYNSRSDSIVEVIFNDAPSVVKNFKSLSYEGDVGWSATITTDQESTVTDDTTIPETRTVSGVVDLSDWEDYEGKRFAWIRGATVDDTAVDLTTTRPQALGVGTVSGNTYTFTQPVGSLSTVGSKVYFFQASESAGQTTYGTVHNLAGDLLSKTTNSITVTPSTQANRTAPSDGDFFFTLLNEPSEKSGVIGFFAIVRMVSTSTDKVELYAVNSNVFASTR